MRYKIIFFIFVSFLYGDFPHKDNIELFPNAKEGYKRYIVEVPHKAKEERYRLELQIGKNMYMDCNEYRFEGILKVESLENNESYVYVTHLGKTYPISSLVCKDGKKDKFVFLSIREDLWKKYNSNLPKVIYVPKEYEVRYCIWKREKYRRKAVNR